MYNYLTTHVSNGCLSFVVELSLAFTPNEHLYGNTETISVKVSSESTFPGSLAKGYE